MTWAERHTYNDLGWTSGRCPLRFQALMFARDGYPLKNLASHKKLNYILALRAAQAIMSSKDYASFSDQMD